MEYDRKLYGAACFRLFYITAMAWCKTEVTAVR